MGTFYKLTPSGTLTILYDFNEGYWNLPGYQIQATDGNFYGVLNAASGPGSVYKITSEGTFTSLYAFHGPDGNYPQSLVQGLDGNFYGTTVEGGINGTGAIFMITPAGDLTTLYSFGMITDYTQHTNADGASPWPGLVQAPGGTFYGATTSGGAYGHGTAFHLVTGLPYVPGDFNRDSKPDILFQNRSTGQLAHWYLLEGSQDGRTSITPTQDPHCKAMDSRQMR